MIRDIAYTMVLGKPLIAYGGMVTYTLLILTAAIAITNHKGIHIIPFKWHHRMAIATIVLATIHAILGISAYLNF